jgi:hypothetical protein
MLQLTDQGVEHRWGGGQYFDPPSTDGAWFDLYRQILIQEQEDETLLLLPATPWKWLEDGKRIEICRAPTYFGPLSMTPTEHRKNNMTAIWMGILVLAAGAADAAGDELASEFANPPESAKPQVYWQWINGNVTREGITADLEAMHRVGINGALVQTVGGGPPGPMQQMNPQFFEMMEHAAREADRLGMTISMHNVSGWAGCGGPWIQPEQSMQFVTSSEVVANGPATFNGTLPQPPMTRNFYRDIAVWAFPTPADEQELSSRLTIRCRSRPMRRGWTQPP